MASHNGATCYGASWTPSGRLDPPRRTPARCSGHQGALSPDQRFLEACTSAGLPAGVPADVHLHARGPRRPQAAGIAPSLKPCILCGDLPCVAACPDGALVDPAAPSGGGIGIAKVDPRLCVTFRGERCDRCYRPALPDRAIMTIGGRPLVGSGACTGCGLCEQACPETPKAIVVIAERLLVPGLRVPKSDYRSG